MHHAWCTASRSAFVFPPPGIARQDWKIVRALGEFVGVTLPYSDDEEMEERVQTLVPLTLNMDEVTQSEVRRGRKMAGTWTVLNKKRGFLPHVDK